MFFERAVFPAHNRPHCESCASVTKSNQRYADTCTELREILQVTQLPKRNGNHTFIEPYNNSYRTCNGKQALNASQKTLSLTERKLLLAEPTRWSSYYRMLERLLEEKRAIRDACMDLSLSVNQEITDNDWCLMKRVSEIEFCPQTIHFVCSFSWCFRFVCCLSQWQG